MNWPFHTHSTILRDTNNRTRQCLPYIVSYLGYVHFTSADSSSLHCKQTKHNRFAALWSINYICCWFINSSNSCTLRNTWAAKKRTSIRLMWPLYSVGSKRFRLLLKDFLSFLLVIYYWKTKTLESNETSARAHAP